jgi:signal peptidase I
MLENATNTVGSNWSAERSALLADVLRRGARLRQGVRLRVYGESMLPALWPGDVVEIANCPLEGVQPGEIVLALRDGRLFLHRFVVRCTPDTFLLRGDSMAAPDPPYPSEALLGRLVRDTLRPGFGAKWSRALGTLLCHCDMARRLVLKIHSLRRASQSEVRSLEPDIRSAKLGAS